MHWIIDSCTDAKRAPVHWISVPISDVFHFSRFEWLVTCWLTTTLMKSNTVFYREEYNRLSKSSTLIFTNFPRQLWPQTLPSKKKSWCSVSKYLCRIISLSKYKFNLNAIIMYSPLRGHCSFYKSSSFPRLRGTSIFKVVIMEVASNTKQWGVAPGEKAFAKTPKSSGAHAALRKNNVYFSIVLKECVCPDIMTKIECTAEVKELNLPR